MSINGVVSSISSTPTQKHRNSVGREKTRVIDLLFMPTVNTKALHV